MGRRGRKATSSSRSPKKGVAQGRNQIRLDQLLKPRRSTRRSSIVKTESSEHVSDVKNSIILDPIQEKAIATRTSTRKSTKSDDGNAKRQSQSAFKQGNPREAAEAKSKLKLSQDEQQDLLKGFDLNNMYGPCRGISRRARFLRAIAFQLKPQPPQLILEVLDIHKDDPNFQNCIWDQHHLLKPRH